MKFPWPSKTAPISPELRLVARTAGIDPARLVRAINDPEHLFKHVTADEMERVGNNWARLPRKTVLMAVPRINAAIDAAVAHHRKEKSHA